LNGGNLKACSLSTVERILEALGARLVVYVDWRGGELDRLLDADHAQLQERWARFKQRVSGHWESRQEVTCNHYGDRGSSVVFARTGAKCDAVVKSGKGRASGPRLT
jgi:hypothetical protein